MAKISPSRIIPVKIVPWQTCPPLLYGISALFLCRMSHYCMYDSDDVATYLTRNGSITLHLTDLSVTAAWGRFWLLTSFSFPPVNCMCCLLCCIPPTNIKHMIAHTSPYRGGGGDHPPTHPPHAPHPMPPLPLKRLGQIFFRAFS